MCVAVAVRLLQRSQIESPYQLYLPTGVSIYRAPGARAPAIILVGPAMIQPHDAICVDNLGSLNVAHGSGFGPTIFGKD